MDKQDQDYGDQDWDDWRTRSRRTSPRRTQTIKPRTKWIRANGHRIIRRTRTMKNKNRRTREVSQGHRQPVPEEKVLREQGNKGPVGPGRSGQRESVP